MAVRVKVEVASGAAARIVDVTASSIQRALELAGGEGKARVIFPIDPENFFADGHDTPTTTTTALVPDAAPTSAKRGARAGRSTRSPREERPEKTHAQTKAPTRTSSFG